jgi:hypothetical protein
MSAADSARRDCLAVTAESSCPSMMRANVPATGGQILPNLTRAVCGYERMGWRAVSRDGWERST